MLAKPAKSKLNMSSWALRELCIEHDWFTGGSCEQYEKLFQMNEDLKFTTSDLAMAIWLCTPDSDLDEILTILREAVNKYCF